MLITTTALVASMLCVSMAKPSVVALPSASKDVDARALSSTVAGALHAAANERGLAAVSVDRVPPIAQSLQRCADESCRLQAARRLGAKWAIEVREQDALVLVDVESEAAIAEVVLADASLSSGGPRLASRPAVHARAVGATAELLEKVAPLAVHKRERAVSLALDARRKGDRETALLHFKDAIEHAQFDDGVVDLWLLRARLFKDDPARAALEWDALAHALGPNSAGAQRLSSDARQRLHDTLKEHLALQAQALADAARTPDDLIEAAIAWERIAQDFDDDDALLRAVALRAHARSP